jgi:hypothetical protein
VAPKFFGMLISIASIRKRTQQEKSDIADTRNCGIYVDAIIGFALTVQLEGVGHAQLRLRHQKIASCIMELFPILWMYD